MNNLQSGLPLRFKRLFYYKTTGVFFAYNSWGQGLNFSVWAGPPTINNVEAITLDIQSTGLFDKNKIELFDGDLLEHTKSKALVVLRWNKSNMAFNLFPYKFTIGIQPMSLRLIDQKTYLKKGNIFEVTNGYKI